DRRRRPAGSGHSEIAVAIRDRKIERLRKAIAMLGQRFLKFLKLESGPKSGDCFEGGALRGALDLHEHRINGLDRARQLAGQHGGWARRVEIWPVSVMEAPIASSRSCQIVNPTALADTPSNTMAAHQSRRNDRIRPPRPALDGSLGTERKNSPSAAMCTSPGI